MDSNIAGLARQRFTIMIPYVDSVDAAEAAELFEATSASERLLVLRDALELVACGSASRRVETAATLIIDYGAADVVNEAFHAKIVLADGVAAYVGSATLLRGSKSTNLERGMLVEGLAVAAVQVLLDAV